MFLRFSGKVGYVWESTLRYIPPYTTYTSWGCEMTVLGQYGNILKVHFPQPVPRRPPNRPPGPPSWFRPQRCLARDPHAAALASDRGGPARPTTRPGPKPRSGGCNAATSHHAMRPEKSDTKVIQRSAFRSGTRKGCIVSVCTHLKKKQMGMHNTHVFNARWKLLNESAEGSTTLETELETQKNNDFQPRSIPFSKPSFLR